MPINTNTLNKIRYTLYAPGYDLVAKLLNDSRKRSIEQIKIKQTHKVLIIGAGTGLDLNYLPLGCEITATDITSAMVKRITLRNRKLNHNLFAEVMDGQNLTYSNETYDFVILHLILAVIPDPIKTLKEAERVLKPGGRITVYDKFIPKNQQASLLRRFLNLFTNLFFSNITRSFEVIIKHSKLKITSDKPADLGGMFRIILLEK